MKASNHVHILSNSDPSEADSRATDAAAAENRDDILYQNLTEPETAPSTPLVVGLESAMLRSDLPVREHGCQPIASRASNPIVTQRYGRPDSQQLARSIVCVLKDPMSRLSGLAMLAVFELAI